MHKNSKDSFGEQHEGIIINNMAQLQENQINLNHCEFLLSPSVSRIAWGQKLGLCKVSAGL